MLAVPAVGSRVATPQAYPSWLRHRTPENDKIHPADAIRGSPTRSVRARLSHRLSLQVRQGRKPDRCLEHHLQSRVADADTLGSVPGVPPGFPHSAEDRGQHVRHTRQAATIGNPPACCCDACGPRMEEASAAQPTGSRTHVRTEVCRTARVPQSIGWISPHGRPCRVCQRRTASASGASRTQDRKLPSPADKRPDGPARCCVARHAAARSRDA